MAGLPEAVTTDPRFEIHSWDWNVPVEYSFLTGTLQYAQGTWKTEDAQEEGLVVETFEIMTTSTDRVAIRAAAQKLAEIGYWVKHWKRSGDREYWLKQGSDGEPTKRTLITDLVIKPVQRASFDHMLGSYGACFQVAITHLVAWQTPSVSLIAVGDQTHPIEGGIRKIPAQPGSLPARLSSAYVAKIDCNLKELWIGIKDNNLRQHDLLTGSEMYPVFRLPWGWGGSGVATITDGAFPGGANNVQQIAGASGSFNIVAVSSVTANWPAAHHSAYPGRYLVMAWLRAPSGGGSTFALTLKHGYTGSGTLYFTEETQYWTPANTVNKMIPLAFIEIDEDEAAAASNYSFQLFTQRIAGAGALNCYAYLLLPVDHYVNVKTTTGSDIVADGTRVLIQVQPNGNIRAVDGSASSIDLSVEFTLSDWEFPICGGEMVFLGYPGNNGSGNVQVQLSVCHQHQLFAEIA